MSTLEFVKMPERNVSNRLELLRLLSKLEETDAVACELIAADVGSRVDFLAEKVGVFSEGMSQIVNDLLNSSQPAHQPPAE